MAIALGFVSLFDFGIALAGWVAFVMLGLIPMQVVAVVLWGANPAFASGRSGRSRASFSLLD